MMRTSRYAIRFFGFILLLAGFLPSVHANYPMPVTLSGKLVVNQVQLSWTQNNDDDFKYYRLVKSSINTLPKYPDQSSIFHTDKRDTLTYSETVDFEKPDSRHYYRLCVVDTENKVRCGNILEISSDYKVTNHNFFTDVEPGAWYEQYVENLYRKAIVTTEKTTRFSPADLSNRAELAEMLVRALVKDESELSTTPVFCDVPSSHSRAKYINHLKKIGVVEGYSGGKCASGRLFKPEQSINRAEALKMILMAFGVMGDANAVEDETYKYKSTDIYTDVHQADWFASYVVRAKEDEVVSGYPDDTFRPANTINKAEMSKIIFNALKKYAANEA